jgi:hypothetical protein
MRHSKDLIISDNYTYMTMATTWIQYVKTEPPNWMRHSNYLVVGKHTMATLWIQTLKKEPPEWMRHYKYFVAGEDTMATAWIRYVRTEPPEYMRHHKEFPGGISTMAIMWILCVKTEPPEYMRHAPELSAKSITMAIAWIHTIKEEPPEWMRHKPELIVPAFGTMAMTWSRIVGTEPPDWMKHSPKLRDKNGRSILEYWKCHLPIPIWLRLKIFTEMKIGCLHIPREVATSSNLVVCSDCGTGLKVYCENECPICREEFEKGNDIIVYDACKHVFCKNCANLWNVNSTKCPCCRKGD